VRVEERPAEPSINVLTAPFDGRIEQPIELLDTTLREGEQAPGVVFSTDEKLEIARALDEVGVPWVSVGFPAVSAAERATCRRIVQAGFRFRTAALSRLLAADIDATVDAGIELVSLFLGGSDSHLFDKLHSTEAKALGMIEAAVRHAKDRGAMVGFGVEDFSRTPLPRLLRMLQVACDAGADQLTFPDTLGVLTPTSAGRILALLRALFPCPLVLHFHNDLGLALANTLAGLEAGAQMAHVTVTGIGERTGNTCLEELAVVLKVKYGRDLGLRLEKLPELCALVHRFAGTQPPDHKPVTGRWCFTHESGIHVAGILANPECYQPYPPTLIGRHHEIVFGKHSGVHGVAHLAERAGLELSEAGRKAVLERVKTEAERRKGSVAEEEVLRWVREEAGATAVVEVAAGVAGQSHAP
jgi:isopropylmalate/homocitrate/citramalate synthase